MFKIRNIGILSILIFIWLFFAPHGAAGEVSYDVSYEDAQGDVTGTGAPTDIVNAADIMTVSSHLSGKYVVFTLTTVGDIVLDSDTNDYSYTIFIDTNGDGSDDFKIVASSMYGSSFAIITSSDGGSETISTINTSGGTLTITVSQDSFGTPSSWDIYASTFHTYYGDTTVAIKDWAPQEGFSSSSTSDTSDDGTSTGDDSSSSTSISGNEGVSMDTGTYPGDETPTDSSISVKITNVKYDYSSSNGRVSYDIRITGTTSGVDHCWIVFVSYYDDGTRDTYFHWQGEFNEDDNSYMKEAGYETLHFIPTSAEWKTWEYKAKGVTTEDSQIEGKTVVKVEIFVRAFGDNGNSQWNQDSHMVILSSSSGSSETENGNTTGVASIPGYDAGMVMAAISMATGMITVIRRRE